MKTIGIILAVLTGMLLVAWLGLQVQPRPLPPFSGRAAQAEFTAVPGDLPAPVSRFYDRVYGEEMPQISSMVISGRGTMRINGITMPVRWRFSHQSGKNYRHYIETTWFGFPLLRVNEWYLSGTGRLELPFGISEGRQVDQGANLGLWSETLWASSVWLTDPRIIWGKVDENTATLTVPYRDKTQTFIVRFEPESGLVRFMESMRYKGEGSQVKTLWINEARAWLPLDGGLQPVDVALTWYDEGTPWAKLQVEEVIYNADLTEYIKQDGP